MKRWLCVGSASEGHCGEMGRWEEARSRGILPPPFLPGMLSQAGFLFQDPPPPPPTPMDSLDSIWPADPVGSTNLPSPSVPFWPGEGNDFPLLLVLSPGYSVFSTTCVTIHQERLTLNNKGVGSPGPFLRNKKCACNFWLLPNVVVPKYVWGIGSRTPMVPKSKEVQVLYIKWRKAIHPARPPHPWTPNQGYKTVQVVTGKKYAYTWPLEV